ncbi:Retrovirus-related Pol poly from transposon TNT 1-94 [Paramuricea clavata]|uniref:Retrovirus-related Pol poly from transposon TNT 1-94 n=1 Tax=Paramuricea clavata TaxID=317549 RepID=A0A7D9DWT0_PARCT|nr:Retrovirus-related Pol poly from transposon TNT 1-94 [Paramuricea clavata]
MLADVKLRHKYWAKTLSTAVYLRNRSPSVAVKGKTPFEAWAGQKPNVKHLRVFGCEAYAHVPKDERKKLDSKPRKCIFLGYGAETKGYRLYDSNRARVFHSRDVQFNESSQEPEQMTAKTGTKKNSSGVQILERESITVQRLSAVVSGKAQKYARVGARESVPYEYDEVTVENIKRACLGYFDVGEVKQIPNLSLVHVRFVEREERVAKVEANPPRKKRKTDVINISPIKLSPNAGAARRISKFIPRSMSTVEMLKLGREIESTPTTEILVYDFDLGSMTWYSSPVKVNFVVDKDPLGTGGLRQAFKATSKIKGFDHTTWVVKKYVPKTVLDIEVLRQTVEQHTKKTVQMHNLARNFTAKLQQEVVKVIAGTFDKHINITGDLCGDADLDVSQKGQCFVHYTFERSDKQLMVTDILGCGYTLFDPEVASKENSTDGESLFCTGNLSTNGIDVFTSAHTVYATSFANY